MIAPLAKFIDWSVLQIGYAMLPQSLWREPANERDLKLEQAVQFLNGPDFIPAESLPAQLDFIPDAPGGRFRFPTPRPCEFAENNVVHGRLYRCADAWQKRPVIILLHGGGDFPGNQLGFHLFARHCNRAGFNAATLGGPDADIRHLSFADVFKTSLRSERDRRGDPALAGRSVPHWQQKLR